MLHALLLPALLPLPALEPVSVSVEPQAITLLTTASLPSSLPRADDEATFSYSYIEVGATRFDVENLQEDADTYYAEASLGLFGFLNLFANYENLSLDFDNVDTDIWRLGAGVHFSVAPRLDLTGDVAWLFSQLDSDTRSEDTNGSQVRVGARCMVLDADAIGLELFGRGIAINLDDSFYSDNSSTGFDAGLRVHFLGSLSVAGAYTKIENDDSAGVSVRFSF